MTPLQAQQLNINLQKDRRLHLSRGGVWQRRPLQEGEAAVKFRKVDIM